MTRRSRFWIAAGGLSACLALPPWLLRGSEPDKPAAPTPADADAQADLDASALAACFDPAFDKYVDVGLIGKALDEGDAALMADAALQLAEAERVLQRSLPGVSADALFRTAARMAAAKNDKETLKRLEKAAAARGDKGLAQQVAAAEKLAGPSREAASAFSVSMDAVSPDQFVTISQWSHGFQEAAALGDAAHLDVLGQVTPLLDGLDPQQHASLAKQAAEAKEQVGPAGDGKQLKALKALAAASRGWGLPDIDIPTPRIDIPTPHIDIPTPHIDIPTPHIPPVKIPPVKIPPVKMPRPQISPDPINIVPVVTGAWQRAGHAWTKKVRDPVVNAVNAVADAPAKGQRKFDDERSRIPLPAAGADLEFIKVPGGTVDRQYPVLVVNAPNGGYVGDGMWYVYITRKVRATFRFQVQTGQARVLIARVRTTDDAIQQVLYTGAWKAAGFAGSEWVETTPPPLPSNDEAYCALLELDKGAQVNVLELVTVAAK